MKYYIGTRKKGSTLVIEARRNLDYLSCDIYDYFGQRETTKTQLKVKRYKILAWLKMWKPRVYESLRFAIVD